VAKRKGRVRTETREATAAAPAPGRGRGVVRQLVLLAGIFASVYVVAALATYDPRDPSFTHFSPGPVQNAAGPLGAWIADALFQTLGLAAWGAVLVALFLSWRLAGRSAPPLRVELAWAVLAWSFTCLVGLADPGSAAAYPPAGLVGMLSLEGLRAVLGPAGAWIVSVGAFLTALPFGFGFEWSQVAAKSLASAEKALPHVQAAGSGAARIGTGAARTLIKKAGEGTRALVQDLRVAPPPVAEIAAAPVAVEEEEPRDGETVVATPMVPDEPRRADDLPSVFDDDAGRPTQAVQRELVEVQWDPTDVPEARKLTPTPPTVVPPLEDEPADQPEPERVAGSVIELAAHDVPQPKKKSARKPKPAVEITPGQLSSGGDTGRSLDRKRAPTAFQLPDVSLLDTHRLELAKIDEKDLERLAHILEQKLQDFGVQGQVVAIRPGPVITIFEYEPGAGVKISKISALADDIAMAMKALRVRIVAPIPGKGVVGIEIPNRARQTVWFRDLLTSDEYRDSTQVLPMTLGKSVEGNPTVADLAEMPHLLVGGTTGSGKSVGVNAMLLSMLYRRTPEELRLILIDPKMLEFELYRDIPHLLHPVITEARLASAALRWACDEMDNRYRLLSRWGTRNIASYNEKVERELEDWTPAKAQKYAPPDWPEGETPPPPKKLPLIVVVIDELADLMMVAAKDVEESIVRLAQKARACGIHLIVATQRPSVDVITGLIKANMPSRIAFQVRTRIDGRTILDQNGAETLLGRGDQLYLPPGVSTLLRLHGPFVSDAEVHRVTDFLRAQGEPVYEAEIPIDPSGVSIDPAEYDPFYDEAVAYVIEQGKASTSMVQRQFKIGYNRAARIVEIMEQEGVVGPADGAKPREVLVGRRTG
jgi:S-DNA-T family DNA segregation ATPase FtsK/SpoIIIE